MTAPTPTPPRIPRPLPGECAGDMAHYVSLVPGEDAGPALVAQADEVRRRLLALPEDRALHRYAPGKWSVKEVLGHLADTERVYAYRALRFGRDDATVLPGFDENRYVPAARSDDRPLGDLLEDWAAVRRATLSLYRGFPSEALLRRGVANGLPVTVRALAWLAVGHARHHLDVLRDRYGVR